MRKYIVVFLLCAVSIFPLSAKTIEKNNYLTINFSLTHPQYDLKRIVNKRYGQGIAIDWQNFHFKNFPIEISFQYNEWGEGKSGFEDWNTSRVIHSKLSIGWVEMSETRHGAYGVLLLSVSRWRVEKDGNFFLSTTKVYPDAEVGYITKSNWKFSLRGTGNQHLNKDIKINTIQFSIGKRF